MQMEIKRKLGSNIVQEKIDFKTNSVTRHKEGHNIVLRPKIQQTDITI